MKTWVERKSTHIGTDYGTLTPSYGYLDHQRIGHITGVVWIISWGVISGMRCIPILSGAFVDVVHKNHLNSRILRCGTHPNSFRKQTNCIGACYSLVRPLPGVLPHVLLERARVDARVLALRLWALDVEHAGVNPHVSAQLVLPREELLTNLATERLLPCKQKVHEAICEEIYTFWYVSRSLTTYL